MCEQLYLTDDRLLFDKIRGGNAKAFEYAFRKFSPRLEAFAQKYTNDTNEAEDIVQDVFLKLWERRELLDNISLTSFLFMMVRNSCLNYLTYIIHSGFISGYQNRYGDNLKPPTNVYHRMTA